MAWWSDGTTNQFIMGEKHVPAAALNICEGREGSSTLNATNNSYSWDCGIGFAAGGWCEQHAARAAMTTTSLLRMSMSAIRRIRIVPPSVPGIRVYATFWSVTVRPVSVTIRPAIIAWLVDTKDGNSVALP